MTRACPKCGFASKDPASCSHCGINFEGYKKYLQHQSTAAKSSESGGSFEFLKHSDQVFVKQDEDALRLITGIQTKNGYALLGADSQPMGYFQERGGGSWTLVVRLFLRSHRPWEIDLVDAKGAVIAFLDRPFFFFLPEVRIFSPGGTLIGTVQKRFTILRSIYSLFDSSGSYFAGLRGSFFGGRTLSDVFYGNRNYEVTTLQGEETGSSITRIWNGLLNRVFTDKDTYSVEFNKLWTPEQRLVILAAAISIDFDAFESDKSMIGAAEDGLGLAATVAGAVTGMKDDDSNGG